jgi:hypothetical protein
MPDPTPKQPTSTLEEPGFALEMTPAGTINLTSYDPLAETETPAKPIITTEQFAQQHGWDPQGGVSAEDYLRDQIRQQEALQRDLREVKTTVQRLQETPPTPAPAPPVDVKQIEKQLEQLEDDLDVAMLDGDKEKVKELMTKRTQLEAQRDTPAPPPAPKPSAPDPELKAWAERNPWFGTDPVLSDVARAIGDRLLAQGKSMTETLQELDTYMAKMLPQPQPPARPAPNPVAAGQIAAHGVPLAGADAGRLPPEAVQIGKSFVEEGLYKSLDEYAREYFQINNGE